MRTFPIFLLFLENGSAGAESTTSTTAQISSTTSMISSTETDSSTSATSSSTTSLVASSTENPQNTSDIAPTKAPQEPIESQLDSHTSITTPTASQFEDDHQPTEATLIAKNITSRQLNTSSLPILNETSTIFEENPTETSTNSTTLTSSATTTETTVTTRPTTTTLATTRVADENANTTLSQDTPSGRSSTSSTTTQSSGKETTTSIIFTPTTTKNSTTTMTPEIATNSSKLPESSDDSTEPPFILATQNLETPAGESEDSDNSNAFITISTCFLVILFTLIF